MVFGIYLEVLFTYLLILSESLFSPLIFHNYLFLFAGRPAPL